MLVFDGTKLQSFLMKFFLPTFEEIDGVFVFGPGCFLWANFSQISFCLLGRPIYFPALRNYSKNPIFAKTGRKKFFLETFWEILSKNAFLECAPSLKLIVLAAKGPLEIFCCWLTKK